MPKHPTHPTHSAPAPLLAIIPIILLALTACAGQIATPEGWATGAIQNNTLYIGTRAGDIRALDTTTGETRWRTELGQIYEDDEQHRSIYGKPTIHNNKLYIAGYDGTLYVLNTQDGTRQDYRNLSEQTHIVGSPAIAGDLILIGADDGKLHAFKQQDLQPHWTFQTKNKIWSTPIIQNNTAYITSLDKNLYAINLEDGKPLWTFQTNGAIASTPAHDASAIYFGSFDSAFYAVNTQTGTLKWQFNGAQSWYWGKPIIHADTIYAPSLDGKLYALNKNTGALKWTLTTEGPIVGSPTIISDMIAIGSDDGRLHIVRAADGNPIDTCNIRTEIRSDLTADQNGTIYLTAKDKTIRALHIKTNGNPDETWVHQPDEENPVLRGRVEDC